MLLLRWVCGLLVPALAPALLRGRSLTVGRILLVALIVLVVGARHDGCAGLEGRSGRV